MARSFDILWREGWASVEESEDWIGIEEKQGAGADNDVLELEEEGEQFITPYPAVPFISS